MARNLQGINSSLSWVKKDAAVKMVCFGGETIIDRSRQTELEFNISCKFIVYRRLEVCKNYDRVKVGINVRVLFVLGDSY